MPVEDAAFRVWFWLYLSQKIPAMGWFGCLQKDMDEITENPMIKSLVSTGHGNHLIPYP